MSSLMPTLTKRLQYSQISRRYGKYNGSFCQINNSDACLHAAATWALPLASGRYGKNGVVLCMLEKTNDILFQCCAICSKQGYSNGFKNLNIKPKPPSRFLK